MWWLMILEPMRFIDDDDNDDDKTLDSVPERVPTPLGIAKPKDLSGVES